MSRRIWARKSHAVALVTVASKSFARRRHERLYQGSFGIGEVVCVAQSSPAISLPSGFCPSDCESVRCCKPTESQPTEIVQLSFWVRLLDVTQKVADKSETASLNLYGSQPAGVIDFVYFSCVKKGSVACNTYFHNSHAVKTSMLFVDFCYI